MKKVPPAANPQAFVAALDGWRRTLVDALCAAVRGAAPFEEAIKWGNLVFLSNGPAVVIRAEEERVLLIFLRGQRLLGIEPRLKGSGKYELASLELRQGMSIPPARARRLAKEAASLNRSLGDPTKAARKPAKPATGEGKRRVATRRSLRRDAGRSEHRRRRGGR